MRAAILVVEDSPTQAERLRCLLEDRGHDVMVAANGGQALAAARARPPALVITDIVMPEMDGYTLCGEIKADQKLKDTPVILLTSLASPLDVIKGLECGADNFIRKPYDDAYLVSRVGYVLANCELRKTDRMQLGVEISLGGQRHFITSERQQILDLLISTYEQAIQMNDELKEREFQLARSYQSLQGIYRIAGGLNQATTEQEVAEMSLEKAVELPGVQAGWISLREGESSFRIAAARNLPPTVEVPGHLLGDCLCRQKLGPGASDREASILECERLQQAGDDMRGLRYHAAVPLWIGQRRLGVMNLVGPEHTLFGDDDLTILNGIGNQIGVALDRARLYQHLEAEVAKRTVALAAEVAERKAAQEALRDSEERYRLLFESNPLPMWLYDVETLQFLAVNDAAVERYGYSRSEFLGMTIKDIRPAEDVSRLVSYVAEAPTTLFNAGGWRHRKKDGTIIIVEITSHGLVLEGRRARLVLTNDITERSRLEEQLRQSQKMEAVGQLAGGVAHDFNNLLTAITGYGDLLRRRLAEEDPLRRYLNEMLRSAERAASLTRQLLVFSRKQVLNPRVLDLNAVVADVDNLVRRLIGEDIDVVTVLAPGLWRVKADPGQIEQVFVNLAVNARDAMPRGGKLTIETGNVELSEEYAGRHLGVRPGRYVMLGVTDNGCGMDAETLSHIFEPFFTTKEPGKGTGLGLSTVFGIVKQSGGNVWVYSEPGRGTTFKVYLPGVTESAEPIEPAPAVSEPLGGGETILLVEDENAVRELVREVLETSGYTVLVASNAQAALQAAEGHQGPIHLVLTDLVMPGMGGPELTRRLLSVRPETRTLYMSGYTSHSTVHNGALETGLPFLQKPFTPEALARRVRELLDAPPERH